MKIMHVSFPIIAHILFVSCIEAQSVTFTHAPSLLSPAPGFYDGVDCVVDMNGDYLDDVVRIKSVLGGPNNGIYIDYQQPDGSFNQQWFAIDVIKPNFSICAGDLDNNGFNDLLLAANTIDFVLAASDGMSYERYAMPSQLVSQRSTISDINQDGWLDAFVCHDFGRSIPFRNTGEGIMIPDSTLILTSHHKGNYAAIWTDYNNDNRTDLYVSKCTVGGIPGSIERTNLLYRNTGEGTFIETAATAGIDDNAQTWCTVFEDFDNDGDFDAFVVNHDEANRLYRNNGDGTFTDVIGSSGLNLFELDAYENSAGDFNNDGFIDIFSDLTTPLKLGAGDLTFTEHHAPVFPGAIGDLNNDGFLDVVRLGEPWLNDGNANHWVKFNLRGSVSNRNGIGSRIEIFGDWGMQIREVRAGQSYTPMSSLTTHFGLGAATMIDSVVVKWPSGIRTILTGLSGDSTYLVAEPECILPQDSIVYIGPDRPLCPGEIAVLVSPNGYADYLWSDGSRTPAILISSGADYQVQFTDSAGCISLSNVITVQYHTDIVPEIIAEGSNRICTGDTLHLVSSSAVDNVWSNGSTTQGIEVTQSGSYYVSIEGECSGQQLTSEAFIVNEMNVPDPIIADVMISSGDSIVLTANSDNCYWYDQPLNGTLLGTGATFQTPALDTDETYYVECRQVFPGSLSSGGKADTSGTTDMSIRSAGLIFEVWEPILLQSVDVYVPLNSNGWIRTIQLLSDGQVIAEKEFILLLGLYTLQLDFMIPEGKYELRSLNANMLRNTGPQAFPFPLGQAGSIIGSSFADGAYYYFYNWQIRSLDFTCSSNRIPVHVFVSGTDDEFNDSRISIYPNPVSDFLNIESDSGSAEVFIYNAHGVLMSHRFLHGPGKAGITVRHWPRGVYVVQVRQESRVRFFKVILQ